MDVEALLVGQEESIKRAFRQFLSAFAFGPVHDEVVRLLAASDINGALAIVDSYVVRMGNVLSSVHSIVGQATMTELAELLPAVPLALSFDVSDPFSAEILRTARLNFIRDFTGQQRNAVRQALNRTYLEGEGTQAAARAFRGAIGLTAYQEQIVQNYRGALINRDRDALERALRDRRFDDTVRAAIERDLPLTARQIDLMVERYRARMLAMRAETIARTEGVTATSQAREEARNQMTTQAGIERRRVRRIWNSTADERVRDWHETMNGQERGVDEPFIDGLGNRLDYPGDPKAPAKTTISCFPGTVNISPAGLKSVITRHYSGELIELFAAGDIYLPATPNHPILTQRGWVAAGDIMEGDYLVYCDIRDHIVGNPKMAEGLTTAQNLADLAEFSGTVNWPSAAIVNLHGEMPDHQVKIISPPRELRDRWHILGSELFGQLGLKTTDMDAGLLFFHGATGQSLGVRRNAEASSVSGVKVFGALLRGHPSHPDSVGFRTVASTKTKITETESDSGTCHPELVCDGLNGDFCVIQNPDSREIPFSLRSTSPLQPFDAANFTISLRQVDHTDILQAGFGKELRPSKIARYAGDAPTGKDKLPSDIVEGQPFGRPVRVFRITKRHFEGPVFTIETDSGIMIANGIICHNCRCTLTYRILPA